MASEIRFTRVVSRWRVRLADGTNLGMVWGNGTRMRARSWTARDPQGAESRHGSRQQAAEHLARKRKQ